MKYLFHFAVCCSLACNKQAPPLPPNHNEFNATVLFFTSGRTINVNATGPKAIMGCDFGTFVEGTDTSNASVYCRPIINYIECITTTGTYPFSCEYRTDITSNIAPSYANYGTAHPGSITFTVKDQRHMEGYFDAVCKMNNGDSVVVTGTFKGDHLD
jgi:hypothetical protein